MFSKLAVAILVQNTRLLHTFLLFFFILHVLYNLQSYFYVIYFLQKNHYHVYHFNIQIRIRATFYQTRYLPSQFIFIDKVSRQFMSTQRECCHKYFTLMAIFVAEMTFMNKNDVYILILSSLISLSLIDWVQLIQRLNIRNIKIL